MSKPTDIKIKEVSSSTAELAYRTPMKFGGRVVENATVLDVDLTVETRDGRVATGHGSMPMSDIWAWPSKQVASPDALAAMVQVAESLVIAASDYSGQAHPLEITTELEPEYERAAEQAVKAAGLPEPMPKLAQLVATSPLEAAIHDAYGKALEQNAYNVLGAEFVNSDLSSYLGSEFAGKYLDQYTLREPKPQMPLYHLVGALDPLTDGDIATRINDGLPETLGEWIAADGLTHLKIKLNGDDLSWDVDRVAGIEETAAQAQAARGCEQWSYSLDFNEKCANVQYVLDFLRLTEEKAPAALGRVQYIEQPTHRNLKATSENRMHEAAAIKPVVIDESLVDLESLLLARELGYSGVALKACKGQTGALLMAAAAQHYGMFLCVQDLTCPGYSFLHSASLSARVPGVAAIEGNSRQYCPVGNQGWDERFPGMFRITDGMLETAVLNGPGLGF